MQIQVFRRQLPLRKPYRLSFGTIKVLDTFYVQVEEEGKYGFGEITPLPGYSWETPQMVEQLLGDMPGMVCQMGIESTLEDLCERAPFFVSGMQCALETQAMGSAELSRSIVPPVSLAAYCAGDTPEHACEEASMLVNAGYRVLKMKIGFTSLDSDVARVTSVCHHIEGRAQVRLDANQSLDFESALRLCCELDGSPVQLLEQPFRPEAWGLTAKLAGLSPVPIMLDESIWTRGDIQRAAEAGARYVKLKLCKHPGLSATESLISFASQLGLGVIFGNGVQSALGNTQEAWVYNKAGLTEAAELNGFLKLLESPFRDELAISEGKIHGRGASFGNSPFRMDRPLLAMNLPG